MSEPDDEQANEVCIVDDDPSVLKSMHYLLASEGFKVRPFNKAQDFLAHAGANHGVVQRIEQHDYPTREAREE